MATSPKTRPYKHVRAVEVHLWGMHIGSVALDPSYGYYVFAYTPACAAKGVEPAPLHMPVANAEPYLCWRRFKIEPPCRLNFEPGLLANL